MHPALTGALPSLGKLRTGSASSSTNAYELLPASANGSPLLPSGQPSRTTKQGRRASRRFWCLLVALLATVFIATMLGLTIGGGAELLTTTSSASNPHHGSSSSDEGGQDTLHELDYAADVVDGHPRFHLPIVPQQPPAQPLPYPAPSPSCLLHLWTLAAPSEFDPAQCDLSAVLEPLDAVVTFVNGTGDLFRQAYDETLARVNADGGHVKPAKRHYSNMGELRFALRSIARNLAGGRLGQGTVHGVGSDFASPVDDKLTRLGQIPHWLDWNLVQVQRAPASQAARKKPPNATDLAAEEVDRLARRDTSKTLSWSFHSEIYQGDAAWKAEALPTFNSFAIESQLANVPSLSPTFVSLNDDFMVLHPLAASDFHTALFGPVLRVQDDLKVTGKAKAKVGDSGEWGGLEWAAWILNHRHPTNGLEYLNHLPKTLTQVHLHELSLTFKDALHESSLRRFREQKTHGPDIEIAFLATHYLRQRFREALLFSYVVARSGGRWGAQEKGELRALGVDGWAGKVGQGKKEGGWAKDEVREVLERSGEEVPLATEYRYTTASGLPRNPFTASLPTKLDLSVCLGPWWTAGDDAEVDAVEMFRRLAFENIQAQCGGLLLSAILSKSPEPGLTAVLPRKNTFFQPSRRASPSVSEPPHIYAVPHLPLTPTWQEADFRLDALFPAWDRLPAAGVDLREWTVRLLGRYRYALGDTPSLFTSIRSISSMQQLESTLNKRPEVALLALNDDIPATYPEQRREEIKHQLRDWGERHWPGREAWETEDP